MTHADWHLAMLNEPTDDLVRLAFADWLEERGEGDRAAWVRLALEVDRMPRDGAFYQARERANRVLERCLPAYWKDLPQITTQTNRGLVDFSARTMSDAKRLGGTRWLPQALADGWVGVVRFDSFNVGHAVRTAWEKQARGVPLGVAPYPQYRADRLGSVLEVPDLYELKLFAWMVTDDVADRLAAHPGLRLLDVDGGDAIVPAVARVPNLRQLTLGVSDNWPGLDDLLTMTANPALRRLRCGVLRTDTNARLDAVRAARPDLTVEVFRR